MKILLMIFLVASNYFPNYQENTNKLPYTQLNGVFIERGDCINLEFVAYTVPDVNKKANITVMVNSNGCTDVYENEYYDLEREDILQLDIDDYIEGADVHVVVSNFFYPNELFEYSFFISPLSDGYYDIESKRVYSNNPYFCSFNIHECKDHYLFFPYYKDVVYIDYQSKNYLDYFKYYVDDFYDVNFSLFVEYDYKEYLFDLSVNKNGGEHYFKTNKLYYNSTKNLIETEKNGDNYKIAGLDFPVKSDLRLTLIISGTINYSLNLIVTPYVKLFGNCEEALFCFVEVK